MFLHGQGRARIPAPLRSPRSAEASSPRSPLIDRFPAVASRPGGGRDPASAPVGSQSTSRTSARRQAQRWAKARRAIDSRRSQGCFVLGVLPRLYREASRSVAVCWNYDSRPEMAAASSRRCSSRGFRRGGVGSLHLREADEADERGGSPESSARGPSAYGFTAACYRHRARGSAPGARSCVRARARERNVVGAPDELPAVWPQPDERIRGGGGSSHTFYFACARAKVMGAHDEARRPAGPGGSLRLPRREPRCRWQAVLTRHDRKRPALRREPVRRTPAARLVRL